MLFNGDYFDALLFCLMAALLTAVAVKRRDLAEALWEKYSAAIGKCLRRLYDWLKGCKPSVICLNFALQIIITLFVYRGSAHGDNIAKMLAFCAAYVRVLGVHLLILAVSGIYFALIRTYFSIESFGRRVLTLVTLIMVVIMRRHDVTSVFTLAVFTLVIFVFYCVNMAALFKAVAAAREQAMSVRAIWSSVAGIIGMFIMLFSVLYYETGAVFPDAFNRSISLLDAVYFTLVTFATIGFGDVVATSDFTKAVTIVNALTSIASLIFLVGAIMSFTSAAGAKPADAPDSDADR